MSEWNFENNILGLSREELILKLTNVDFGHPTQTFLR